MWIFRGFFDIFSETTLTILGKLGQNVVLVVPDHLQKTAHQNIFSFSRYSSSKSAFFGIFRARKKFFFPKFFFFIFGIYILQFVKISKKNFWHEKFPRVRPARSDTSKILLFLLFFLHFWNLPAYTVIVHVHDVALFFSFQVHRTVSSYC